MTIISKIGGLLLQAAVLEKKNTIVVQDIPTCEPRAGEVRVHVRYTGICGSDIPRVLKGKVHLFPLVLGHEFSGTVDAVGEDVNNNIVGRLVAGIPLEPCGDCPACLNGDYALCAHYGFVGTRSQGSMAEYVVVPRKNIFLVDEGVSELEAAFFEPATVAIHAIELTKPKPGANVIVLGAGTVGILLAQALRGYGIDNIVVTNLADDDMVPVHAAGFNQTVLTTVPGWQTQAKELANCKAFDYVFDAAGTPETILDAFELAGPKATVCFVGTPKRDVAFSVPQWENLNRKELTVLGSWMSYSAPWPGVEWTRASEFFSSGILRVTNEMIDSIYRLCQTQEAFQRFAEAGKVHGKIVIDSQGA